MKRPIIVSSICLAALAGAVVVLWIQFSKAPEATPGKPNQSGSIPVKGSVTLLDLGSNSCIPCKMMVPVMESIRKKYRGKAAIIFIDAWKNNEASKRFGIRAIPTQIFFDKEGNEVYRHVGFLSEDAIIAELTKMGVY